MSTEQAQGEGAGWSVWPAPAKLNLFLRIVGRRADGYHLLQTVFQLLDWGDSLRLRVREDGRIARLAGFPGVPDAEDLAVRAAVALRGATGSPFGADIVVRKRIPAGGGFGGGSSDAATVLCALNALWGTGLAADELAVIGLRLGADVPVFVRGENAWAEGVGERLVPVDLPPAWYLIVDSGVSVPTTELFQAPDLTRDAAPARIADFVSGTRLGNAFEAVLRRREPRVDEVLTRLSHFGEARLTGTGGGCFVAFSDRQAAEDALAALPPGWRAWVSAGAACSPLHRRLAEWSGSGD
jgi:4-diphosphocytidyl-2-C-methyl-D-erythritol kinase